MPDLKFINNKLYFSILNNSNGLAPLLVPKLNNPDFFDTSTGIWNSLPGIIQLIDGELGITEKMMLPLLNPILSSISGNLDFAKSIAVPTSTDPINDAKTIMLKNLIPSDKGIKPMEKTIIQSMMESHKPLIDFVKILLEMLSVGEDIFAKFLGTSIKVLNKEIGFPSRNPAYWSNDLNYAQTITHLLSEMTDKTDKSIKVFESGMKDNHPIKHNVPNPDIPSSNQTGTDNREVLYIGYFDEDGNSIDPPKWVKDSNKWFSINAKSESGADITIDSPFKQLSKDFDKGIDYLLQEHEKSFIRLESDKAKMLEEIDKRADQINKMDISPDIKQNEINYLNTEKILCIEQFDSLIGIMNDILLGTNKFNNNLDDSQSPNGVNDPAIVGEWVGKTRSAQLRQRYFPEQKSTVQALVDNKGKAKEPYIFIPKFRTNFRGRNIGVSVPLAYPNQIEHKKTGESVIEGNKVYFDKVSKDKKGNKYSYKNHITNIDILFNTDQEKPYKENPVTHFSNDSRLEYVPDNIKDYYTSLEWEEVKEYELRSIKTGKVIKTERETILNKIDIENDYELRLIKVVNIPLIPNEQNSAFDIVPVKDKNRLVVLRKDSIQIMEYINSPKLYDIVLENISIKKEENTYVFELTELELEKINTITNPIFRNNALTEALEKIKQESDSKSELDIYSSNMFRISERYITNQFKPDMYIYIRKEKYKWGDESNNTTDKKIDFDSVLVFKIDRIESEWKKEKKELNKDDSNTHIHLDTINNLLSIPNNISVLIPDYILDPSSGENFIIDNIRLQLIEKNVSNDRTTYKFHKITGIESRSYTSQFDFEYLVTRNIVKLGQDFKSLEKESNFKAYIYIIENPSIVPDIFRNNANQPIIIQGLDKNSIFSVARDTDVTKKNKINTSIFKSVNQIDNIYTVSNIENKELENGLKIEVLKLNQQLSKNYTDKVYSSVSSDTNAYPIRIVTVPNISNKSSDITDSIDTIYRYNNTIPDNYKQNPDGTSIIGNNHSTPDIDETNSLKEGIIFHGLDTRFVDPIKYKHFWLVEAIKKDNRGIVAINGKYSQKDIDKSLAESIGENVLDKGKEWYGLLDKFTSIPMVVTKLIPIITKKLIPLIIKIIQLISNPKKIQDFVLDIGIMDESISKFPENFKSFSSLGSLGKIQEIVKSATIPTTLEEQEKSNIESSDDYYTGIQVGVENPQIISMIDGQASVDFGSAAFGKPIVSFGVDIKAGNTTGPVMNVIKKKEKQTDFNKPAKTKEQPLIGMILNFMKLPLETIFMIFKWVMDWVKKMLNPIKIPGAVAELLSFEWLKNILGKDTIFKILGIPDPLLDPTMYDKLIDSLTDATNDERLARMKEVMSGESGNQPNFIEVLIYDVFVNGKFVRKETEERIYNSHSNIQSDTDIQTNYKNNTNQTQNQIQDSSQSQNILNTDILNGNILGFCGERIFNIKDLIPIPLLTDMSSYNICEIPQILLKPLELISGVLNFIQNLLNSFLSMPTAILGLDPHIKLPRFGEEIPFANIIDDIITKLKETIKISNI